MVVTQDQINPVAVRAPDFVSYTTTVTGALGESDFVELVAAQTGKRIMVLALTMDTNNAGNSLAYLQSGGASGSVIFRLTTGEDQKFVLPWSPAGWCETVSGESLGMESKDPNEGLIWSVTLVYALL